ncbi:MAG: glycosyltransferase [Bifidobacteriaceae bacterium]|jgi:glycosyltransferase involved in cell wall biosynthesis|nr:glycosyltransferase [Bifidobacteriaceae bacterium]
MKALRQHFVVELDLRLAHQSLAVTRALKALPLFPYNYRLRYDSRHTGLDFVFARYPGADRQLVNFLRALKQNSPKAFVIIEFPDYPTEMPSASLPLHLRAWNNKTSKWEPRIAPFVDRFATYSTHTEIHGVPTIRIENGIDVSTVPLAAVNPSTSGPVRLLAVGSMMPWHGFDRAIDGLATYYRENGTRDIVLELVGDGPELTRYRKLATDQGLTARVQFSGRLLGAALDRAFDRADVAVASLGLHRRGMSDVTTLKTREYAARGLPIVTSIRLGALSTACSDFIFDAPANEEPLDVAGVLRFWDAIERRGALTAAQTLRAFAETKMDISVTMAPIVAAINEWTGEL